MSNISRETAGSEVDVGVGTAARGEMTVVVVEVAVSKVLKQSLQSLSVGGVAKIQVIWSTKA